MIPQQVAAHALSTLDRVARLLDGLSENLRRKVIRHCTKQGWKLSTQDTGTNDPDYEAIKSFVLTEAQTEQTMSVYDNERSIREHSVSTLGLKDVMSTPSMSPASIVTPAATPAPVSTPDPIVELTKQFSELALAIQANMQSRPSAANAPNAAVTVPRPNRCMWCD